MSIEEETGTPKLGSQEQKKLQESDSVRKQTKNREGAVSQEEGRKGGRKERSKKESFNKGIVVTWLKRC